MLSCPDHMFLVFELSTRDYVEMARVFLPRTDHMNLQNILIFVCIAQMPAHDMLG